jgi:hypothetical protein
LISGLGRYGLAGMLTDLDGDDVAVRFARRLRLPIERVHKRSVRLTVSFREDRQWRLLDLRAAIESVDDHGLKLKLDLPVAPDVIEKLQSLIGGRPSAPDRDAAAVRKVDPAAVTLTSVAAPHGSTGDAFSDAVHTFSQHWLERILSGIEQNLTSRGQRERGPQARMQTQDDLAQLKDARTTIEMDFRRKLIEVVGEIDQPGTRLSVRESTVDRTLSLLNTARLEDMMGFVDVVQSIEVITHPKMITLCHALTRWTRRNVNEDNNPFRVEKMCESALSSILDNWSVAQSNRQAVNDALRDSAVALGSMFAGLTDVLKTDQQAVGRVANA